MRANSPANESFYVFAAVWLMCYWMWNGATGQLINDSLKQRCGLVFKNQQTWGTLIFEYGTNIVFVSSGYNEPVARSFIQEEQINRLPDFATEGILHFVKLILDVVTI